MAFAQGAGKALDFDGTDDYVDVSGVGSYTTGSTWSAWFNTATITSAYIAIIGYRECLNQYVNVNKVAIYAKDADDWHLLESTTTLSTDTWYLYTAVHTGSALKLYINGVYDSEMAVGTLIPDPAFPSTHIGNRANDSAPFEGKIDEVRIWNVARTQAQIREYMNKKLAGTESNLVGYWRFDDSADPTDDYSPNSNTGALKPDGSEPSFVDSKAPVAGTNVEGKTDVRAAWVSDNSNASSIMTITDGDIAGVNCIIFGHDNAGLTANTSDVPAGINRRLNRVWRLEEYGTLTGDVVFDCTDLGIGDASDLRLLVDADGTFSNATIVTDNLSYSAPNFTVSGHEFVDDYYYTLASTSANNTLPVVLSFFTAQFLNGVPTLYWKTISETDNIGWYVYRNTEEDFTTAERITDYLIEGHGTTTKPHYYIYEDVELDGIPGETYWYWIESVDLGGAFHRYEPEIVIIQGTPEPHDTPEIPKQYGLHQNNPNPLGIGKETTKISFLLHNTARVELKIFNIRGELVKDLYKGIAYGDDEVGIPWDGKDENGIEQKTGIYLYQLKVNGKPYEVKRLIIMR